MITYHANLNLTFTCCIHIKFGAWAWNRIFLVPLKRHCRRESGQWTRRADMTTISLSLSLSLSLSWVVRMCWICSLGVILSVGHSLCTVITMVVRIPVPIMIRWHVDIVVSVSVYIVLLRMRVMRRGVIVSSSISWWLCSVLIDIDIVAIIFWLSLMFLIPFWGIRIMHFWRCLS